MYFLPLLFAMLAYLLVPSTVLAAAVGVISLGFLWFAGVSLGKRIPDLLRGQLAHRILTVKLLRLNGKFDEQTYHAHATLTPDIAENSELRGLLRNAAAKSGDGWQLFAADVRKVFRRDHSELLTRFENIVLTMANQPDGVANESQARLVELGKIWKIKPEAAKAYLTHMKVRFTPAMDAWN